MTLPDWTGLDPTPIWDHVSIKDGAHCSAAHPGERRTAKDNTVLRIAHTNNSVAHGTEYSTVFQTLAVSKVCPVAIVTGNSSII